MFKFHLFFPSLYKKLKNNYRVAMTNMTCVQRACVQCWRNYEYFMLKQCLENIGEGLLHAGLANSRGSWVVGKKSWVVGKKSWVVGKKSWVVGKKSWVVGKKSWVPNKKSWVPRKKSWVLRKKSWVPNKKSWVPRKSLGFEAKCFRIVTFFLLECVFFL